jgi:hypothetical protein
MTKEEADNAQDWAGMDGAIAYQLIDRHANDWNEIGEMMNAWLRANIQAGTDAIMSNKREPVLNEEALKVIEAAPDLLSALERLVFMPDPAPAQEYIAATEQAISAINKARGLKVSIEA